LRDRVIPSLRAAPALLVTCLFAAPYFLIPSVIICGTFTGELVARWQSPQLIAQSWMSAVADDPSAVRRLPDDLASRVPPALSPYQQGAWFGSRYRWQRWVEFECRAVLIWFALYAAAMIWALPQRMRRLPKFALLAAVPLLIGTCFAGPIAELRWPDNYAYLQDYVNRLPGSWQPTRSDDETIILFEKTPIQRGHRIVAYQNGRVDSLTEDVFQKIVAEQGFPIGAPASE
jgi:hypothetical protein